MLATTWNNYIAAHAPYALFQSWEWGEVEKKLGHKVWRLSWVDGIAQVVKVEARRGTFLHIRHGPIGKIHVDDLVALAKREKAWFNRISPQVTQLDIKGFVPAPIHAMDGEFCWVLDLDKTEDELLRGMRKTTRYEIKHATVTVEKTKNLQRFLTLYKATSARQGFVQHRGIAEEFELLDTDLFVARDKNRDLAAAVIIYFGESAIYHHGASIPNSVGASYLLQWEAIREAKKRGKKLYNFWGIAPEDKPNHPWRGITLFKKGFGGREVGYIHTQDLPISPLYRITRTIETTRRIFKGY